MCVCVCVCTCMHMCACMFVCVRVCVREREREREEEWGGRGKDSRREVFGMGEGGGELKCERGRSGELP